MNETQKQILKELRKAFDMAVKYHKPKKIRMGWVLSMIAAVMDEENLTFVKDQSLLAGIKRYQKYLHTTFFGQDTRDI